MSCFAAASVYLRDPSRFATIVRYEDFVAEPIVESARVLQAVGLAWHDVDAPNRPLDLLAHMELDLAGIQTATTVVHTDQGDYDHTNATTLFDDNTTSAMISVSEPEMSLLGYTRDGLNHQWTALTRTPTDYIPVDGGFANPSIVPADEDGSSEAGSGGEAGTSNATVTTP